MRKIIILLYIFLFLFNSFVHASEVTGNITTRGTKIGENNFKEDGAVKQIQNKTNNQAVVLKNNQFQNEEEMESRINNTPSVKVLGIEFYKDGSLLRDELGRVYIVFGDTKTHVLSIEDLTKYSGKTIHNVDKSTLERYVLRKFTPGCLIRGIDDDKIFLVKEKNKEHIKSLKELQEKYFGIEIFNISKKEMGLY